MVVRRLVDRVIVRNAIGLNTVGHLGVEPLMRKDLVVEAFGVSSWALLFIAIAVKRQTRSLTSQIRHFSKKTGFIKRCRAADQQGQIL